MFRKYLVATFAAATLLSLALGAVSAQTGPLRGNVQLTGADGKPAPVQGAVVDVYRTDISGDFHTKSDKKGDWVFAGLPLVGYYVVALSAPGAQPSATGGVRVIGDTPVNIVLSAGDGRRLTADEAKKIASGGARTTGGGGGGKESAEEKAKREEMERKNEEIKKQNERNTNINEIVGRTFKAGNAALMAKNYDEAIKQYQEGLAADPEQGALYTQLSIAHRNRGVTEYNAAIQSKDDAAKAAGLEAAQKDFRESADGANKAADLAKKEPAATDPQAQTSQNARKLAALSTRAESMRLFVTKVDKSQGEAAVVAYQEYMAAETDAARKAKGQQDLAQLLFDVAGDSPGFERALAEYQKILEANPDDLDALLRSGQALFNIGAFNNNDKVKFQEAANYLQRFVDKAPDTNAMRADAKAIIDTMKDQANIKPEKTPATPARKRRP